MTVVERAFSGLSGGWIWVLVVLICGRAKRTNPAHHLARSSLGESSKIDIYRVRNSLAFAWSPLAWSISWSAHRASCIVNGSLLRPWNSVGVGWCGAIVVSDGTTESSTQTVTLLRHSVSSMVLVANWAIL